MSSLEFDAFQVYTSYGTDYTPVYREWEPWAIAALWIGVFLVVFIILAGYAWTDYKKAKDYRRLDDRG